MDDDFNFDDLLEDPQESSTDEEITQDDDSVQQESVQEDDENQDTQQQEDSDESNEVDYSDNPLFRFLQERGVKDPKKIKFTNEDNSTEEVDFNNLTPDEQLDIIRQVADPGLTQDEINTINYLRTNRMNLNQALDLYGKQVLEKYLKENPDAVHQKTYSVDDYTNDDLFLIDLRSRYPNFTDEELNAELEAAKENEELFNKKTETIRAAYKQAEDQAVVEQEQQEQQQIEDLRNNLKIAAGKFNEIQLDYTDDTSDSLVIDDEDKQQMMSYILDQDSEGKSALIRALEDPNQLIELAWYATQGPKVLSELSKYWKGLLAQERNETKKLQSKLDKLSRTSTVVTSPKNNNSKYESVWDNSGLL